MAVHNFWKLEVESSAGRVERRAHSDLSGTMTVLMLSPEFFDDKWVEVPKKLYDIDGR